VDGRRAIRDDGAGWLFRLDERLQRLSDLGDQLEAYAATVDFEMFRSSLEAALAYADGVKGGRPPYDAVMMFKILVIQAQNNLSDDRKSAVRSRIEHVFAEQKYRMGLFIRTIGLDRARLKIGLANLVYNIKRFIWLERTVAAAT
jgi:hypothetical protein